MEKTSNKHTANIVIVDDESDNLKLLLGILTKHGHKVRPASNGKRALETIKKELPDIVLLDIIMPEMDGYEICNRLKENKRTQDIPVIYLSGLEDIADKIKGFEAGAVDYITKPFEEQEVLARVNTHITLRKLQQELQDQNALISKQNKQLNQLNNDKDRFFSIIAHDLRSPIIGFLSFANIMENIKDFKMNKIEMLTEDFRKSAKNLFALLENLLTWSRMQQGVLEYQPDNFRLDGVIINNISILSQNARQKEITITNNIDDTLNVYADYNMIDTVIRNLLANALKFTEAGGSVIVNASLIKNKKIRVEVSDTGIGIPDKNLPGLFRIDAKFQREGTADEKGTGLGLVLCKDFIEKNGGTITVESKAGKGSKFIFEVPGGDE